MDKFATSLKRDIPNILSLTRLLVSPLGAYLLFLGFYWFSFAVLIFAAFSDFLDGFLARRWNVQSNLGRILDPLADKVSLISYLLAFYFGRFEYKPSEVLIWAFLFKEIVIFLGVPLMVKLRWVPEPNLWGKGATYSLFLFLIVLFLANFWGFPESLFHFMELVSILFVVMSAITYLGKGLLFLFSLK